jgi:DNA-binding response OmpR family regulator
MGERPSPEILILEDEALIALDLEDQIKSAGFQVAGVFSSCSAALNWLETGSPDFAILDVELRDGTCATVAYVLHSRNIPFVIYTGNIALDAQLDPIFQQGHWLPKPAISGVLLKAKVGALNKGRDVLPR